LLLAGFLVGSSRTQRCIKSDIVCSLSGGAGLDVAAAFALSTGVRAAAALLARESVELGV
jgi:hypothetical protein